jgi:hypothetical protein
VAKPGKTDVKALGLRGVNVGLNPLERDDSDLEHAQNAITESDALRKRPGLIAFTTSATAGTVLGGIDLPMPDRVTGTRFLFIGRGAP